MLKEEQLDPVVFAKEEQTERKPYLHRGDGRMTTLTWTFIFL